MMVHEPKIVLSTDLLANLLPNDSSHFITVELKRVPSDSSFLTNSVHTRIYPTSTMGFLTTIRLSAEVDASVRDLGIKVWSDASKMKKTNDEETTSCYDSRAWMRPQYAGERSLEGHAKT